jgi:hypothetical protein
MTDQPAFDPQPGIYLGLSDDDYFSAAALGSTDMKALYLDPESWWWETRPESPLRPDSERDPKAVALGKAIHVALLEGLEKYEAHYAVPPDRAAHEDALDTVTELKDWLREREHKIGGNRPELIERILEADPTAPIWDAIYDKAMAGRLAVSRAEDARIRLTRRFIERDPDLIKELDPGLSEVAVFWRCEQTGALMRAKFDRLTPVRPWDLKSFTRRRNVKPRTGALRRAEDEQWHVQVAHYWEAWDRLPDLPVFGGDEAQRAVLADVIATARGGRCEHFGWLFFPNNGAPAPLPLRLRRGGLITEEGRTRLKDARANYAAWTRLYGLEAAWIDTAGVQDIDDDTEGYGFWRAA